MYPESNRVTVSLEQLERRLAQTDATEAFGFALRLFDSFTRILRNLKVELLGMHKTFKRSELKAYHDSHQRILQSFFKASIIDYDLLIPIPSGMKVSYHEVVDTLQSLYEKLNIVATTTTLLAYLKETAVTTKDPSATTKDINRLTKDQTESVLRRLFSSKKTYDVPFKSVIQSFEQLCRLDQDILRYDLIFQQVEKICVMIDQIETIIDRIVTKLENQATIDKPYVTALYQLVKTASIQLDLYGILLAEMQRVEHNFVLVLKALIAHHDRD